MKAILLGIIASLFFAVTFVLNRAMQLSGGSWIWSAALRFLFMLPFLVVIVVLRGNIKGLIVHMKAYFMQWLVWSIVGFGLFYAPLCFAAAYGPSWLVASTWQVTIIAGSLLVPFFYTEINSNGRVQKVRNKIPVRGLLISLIILIGILLMQFGHASFINGKDMLLGIVPVLVAAFSYPLGNRKMMSICKDEIDTYQRVLGMTIASMPFWIVLSIMGLIHAGPPSGSQLTQSLVVAISSGVIATILFFKATDLVKKDSHKLAAVEATQAGEVIFALIGEVLLLGGIFPTGLSLVGVIVVIGGMIIHSLFAEDKKLGKDKVFSDDKIA
ncbi:DMT family transporter [Cellulosilyticum sp. I15G10I2]|uniref:DMT family transporter n=1 Tax=Cellulosilyticum sp. I15G10I2 TaxID=1892843 RepID=UPI00085C893D|nr:multidrug resistance efflux transporter family protein [Cellulosilyticum sp. I15G10I2]